MSRHQVQYAVILMAALCVAACNSDGLDSPTSPSGSSSSRGAVIQGRVTGAALAGTAASAEVSGTMATSRVTVTVTGTDISTIVEGNGNFTLTGVPPGDVQLRFTGSGIDATIMLTGVTADQRITITVALNGNGRGARLESERREDDDDDDDDDDEDDEDDEDDNEASGTISSLSGACPNLTFTIGQTVVRTNGVTRFKNPCATLANGVRVEAEGRRQADGSIMATEVEADDDEVSGAISGLSGSCPNLTFTVGQTVVRTNGITRFKDRSCSALANGRRVEAKGIRQVDGSLMATEVEDD